VSPLFPPTSFCLAHQRQRHGLTTPILRPTHTNRERTLDRGREHPRNLHPDRARRESRAAMERRVLERYVVGQSTEGGLADQFDGTVHRDDREYQVGQVKLRL